jgi:hypothetical protein
MTREGKELTHVAPVPVWLICGFYSAGTMGNLQEFNF